MNNITNFTNNNIFNNTMYNITNILFSTIETTTTTTYNFNKIHFQNKFLFAILLSLAILSMGFCVVYNNYTTESFRNMNINTSLLPIVFDSNIYLNMNNDTNNDTNNETYVNQSNHFDNSNNMELISHYNTNGNPS